MIPIYINSLFALFHPANGRRGVVLCKAIGVEEVGIHRLWHRLAQQLAAAGLPTLRFDYYGTGDSPGHEDEGEPLARWVDDIETAAAWLRHNAGVDEVVLVGLRLGGTLAALAAGRVPDLAGLALLAPAVSGRRFVRETKAMAAMIRREYGIEERAGDTLEAGGFRFSDTLVRELEAVDLCKTEIPAGKRVLLAAGPRDALAPLERHLSAQRATLERVPFDGYDAMIQCSMDAKAPEDLFRHIVAWAAKDAPAGSPAPVTAGVPGALGAEGLRMASCHELPVKFGPGDRLFGIVTEPALRRAGPTFVFLNASLDHHIGAGRMTVRYARLLAEQGISSFRFDFTNAGDSLAPDDPLLTAGDVVYRPGQLADIRAALDALSAKGHRQFVLFGLCSGAYAAVQAARHDPRVVGQVLCNIARLVWRDGMSLDILRRTDTRPGRVMFAKLGRWDKWQRLLTGKRGVRDVARAELRRIAKAANVLGQDLADWLGLPAGQNEVLQWFRDFERRQMRTLFIFGEGDPGLREIETYLGSRARRLRHDPHVQLRLIDGGDHGLNERWMQEMVSVWISELAASWSETMPPPPLPAALQAAHSIHA